MASGWYTEDGEQVRIEQVANGFIVSNGSEKYVYSTLSSMLKALEVAYKQEKK